MFLLQLQSQLMVTIKAYSVNECWICIFYYFLFFFSPGKQTVLLDPVEEEESSAQATFAWALSSTKSTSTIAASLTNGSFEQSLYFNTLKQAELAAEKMVSFFRIVLTHKHSST